MQPSETSSKAPPTTAKMSGEGAGCQKEKEDEEEWSLHSLLMFIK